MESVGRPLGERLSFAGRAAVATAAGCGLATASRLAELVAVVVVDDLAHGRVA